MAVIAADVSFASLSALALFGIVGQYLIWGRFAFAAWKKRHTYYAVTSHRIIAIQNGWIREVVSVPIAGLTSGISRINLHGTVGTLRFSKGPSSWFESLGTNPWERSFFLNRMQIEERLYDWDQMTSRPVPVLIDVERVHDVYGLVSSLRKNPVNASQVR